MKLTRRAALTMLAAAPFAKWGESQADRIDREMRNITWVAPSSDALCNGDYLVNERTGEVMRYEAPR